MHLNFNYQVDPSGTLRAEQSFAITQLVEYRLGGVDFAVCRIAGSPGNTFGYSQVASRRRGRGRHALHHGPPGWACRSASRPARSWTSTATASSTTTSTRWAATPARGSCRPAPGGSSACTPTAAATRAARASNFGMRISAIRANSPTVRSLGRIKTTPAVDGILTTLGPGTSSRPARSRTRSRAPSATSLATTSGEGLPAHEPVAGPRRVHGPGRRPPAVRPGPGPGHQPAARGRAAVRALHAAPLAGDPRARTPSRGADGRGLRVRPRAARGGRSSSARRSWRRPPSSTRPCGPSTSRSSAADAMIVVVSHATGRPRPGGPRAAASRRSRRDDVRHRALPARRESRRRPRRRRRVARARDRRRTTRDLSDARVVWWRRPLPFELDDAVSASDDREFAYQECHARDRRPVVGARRDVGQRPAPRRGGVAQALAAARGAEARPAHAADVHHERPGRRAGVRRARGRRARDLQGVRRHGARVARDARAARRASASRSMPCATPR